MRLLDRIKRFLVRTNKVVEGRWRCNVYGDRYSIEEGFGVAVYHADCVELIVDGYIGEPAGADQDMIDRFKSEGVVGIYVKGVNHD